MKLSSSFQIDLHEPWVKQHNCESQEVWAAFNADRPIRVPVIFSGARTQYLSENKIDYRNYYEDPDEMFRLQLEWKRRARELPLGDHLLGELPDNWTVSVDFHPVATASCFGCPITFRQDAVPAHECMHLSLNECLNMPMPDLKESGLLPRHRKFSAYFDSLCSNGVSFLGRPVKRSRPTLPSRGGGVFSTALDIRGPEIMSDMYENPEFVHDFLERLAEWQIDLHRTWTRLDGMEYWIDMPEEGAIDITDHGIDMLSPELYDTFIIELLLKLCRKYNKKPKSTLHHCGRGSHLFPLIQKKLGLTALHALTWPLNNVARVRQEIGYDVWIVATLADNILYTNPDSIQEAVKEFFTPEVKGKGRLSLWVAGEVYGIPLENYLALYEAVKKYGKY